MSDQQTNNDLNFAVAEALGLSSEERYNFRPTASWDSAMAAASLAFGKRELRIEGPYGSGLWGAAVLTAGVAETYATDKTGPRAICQLILKAKSLLVVDETPSALPENWLNEQVKKELAIPQAAPGCEMTYPKWDKVFSRLKDACDKIINAKQEARIREIVREEMDARLNRIEAASPSLSEYLRSALTAQPDHVSASLITGEGCPPPKTGELIPCDGDFGCKMALACGCVTIDGKTTYCQQHDPVRDFFREA